MTHSFPLPAGLRLLECQAGAVLVLRVASRAHVAYCPLCQQPSRRVHSRYWRTLSDLPLADQPLCLKVQVRRFFCLHPPCRRHLFAERLPNFAVAHAQQTQRLQQALTRLVQVVGSRPGGRLAHRLALSTSATTLLRLERAALLPVLPTPRVLGVDDWAFRKGHHYGTLLYDHEQHCVVDLLPDRTTKTLAQWLTAHPGVEIVTRDRAEAYAEGIREGAPQAQQVADRWHIVKNLGQVLERILEGKRALIRQANVSPARADAPLPPVSSSPVAVNAPKETRDARRACARRQQRLQRYDQVQVLHAQGLSHVAIASQMQIDRRTVGMFLRAEGFPERKERAPARQPRLLTPCLDYLRGRWDAGCYNAHQLLQEIRERGYTGSYSTVTNFLRHLRSPLPAGKPTLEKRIVPKQIVVWTMQREAERTQDHTDLLLRLSALCEPFRLALQQVECFLTLLRQVPRTDQATALQTWLADAQACAVPELQQFALRLKYDEVAVAAGLSLPWSNGAVEGSVNRLKFVKRRGYGRANFDLLRRRVLQPT